MEEKDWKEFVDTGEINPRVLVNIALKFKEHKQLNEKEIAVYREKSNVIEFLLRSIKK